MESPCVGLVERKEGKETGEAEEGEREKGLKRKGGGKER